MKKTLTLIATATLALSSCGTYTAEGAATGGYLGSILGSAIGGISGGYRGSDIGTLVGMAGGAAVGAAIGAQADKKAQAEYEKHKAAIYGERSQRYSRPERARQEPMGTTRHDDAYGHAAENSGTAGYAAEDSGFDPNHGGNDIIEFESTGQSGVYPDDAIGHEETVRATDLATAASKKAGGIEVRNISFDDPDNDGTIGRDEACKVSFEIMNHTDSDIANVTPLVDETTGNSHIHISPALNIESIRAHKGVKYTATIYGDRKLKDGSATIKIGVTVGNSEVEGQSTTFDIKTTR